MNSFKRVAVRSVTVVGTTQLRCAERAAGHLTNGQLGATEAVNQCIPVGSTLRTWRAAV
jgi:hypothetical protein